MNEWIRINEKDNVIVALTDIKNNTYIDDFHLIVKQDTCFGHKIAIKDIDVGDSIYKYGHIIGKATKKIQTGEVVHTHNISTNLSSCMEYEYTPKLKANKQTKTATFRGFKRKNSKVGIRNDIWIIPTVGCVNNVAQTIANRANSLVRGTVERVVAFTHPYGCSQMGEDQENTRKILANLATHPNAGGVLLLGLGCENCEINTIKSYMGDVDTDSVKFLVAQDVEDEIESAFELIDELVTNASDISREDCDVEDLVVGLKCGGSDGLSGITANPTVGKFSDLLLEHGGTSILTEVPEMFGAETILFERCKDKNTFDKAVKLINEFKDYFTSHNQVIYENPSPGNKSGGISTLEDKSLGCTQKSGTGDVVDVLSYGEKVKYNGLNLLYSPGNDLVASTALAASGAQLVLFTTGRGTPFASPVPTIKISSNDMLAIKKSNWIDFDSSELLRNKTLAEMGEKLFDFVIEVSNGKKVKSEENGYYDMAIFKQGVTL